jgi:two-component system LytT family sensor kinase
MLMSLGIVLGAGVISFFILAGIEPAVLFFFSNGMIPYLLINILFILSINIITTGLKIYQESILATENALSEERYLKKEIELRLLTAKLNPHFLFNALNLILSLIKKPVVAEKALISLSDLLRYQLDFSDVDRVPLSREMEGVQKYLTLQKMRFENRLEYQIDCEPPADASVPPFIIQPLIENSIKYNMNHTDLLEIHIHVFEKENKICIHMMDSGKRMSPDMLDKGTGLTATKKRVEHAQGLFQIKNGGIEICFDKHQGHHSG